MKYNLTASNVKEKYKITSQTLYNWRNKNIEFTKLPSGKFMYMDLKDKESTLPKKEECCIY